MEQRWHVGTWMVPSYDPETNMIFVGTSVTIPAPKFTLGGADKQHLYHNSTLALDADTGKIVWYYQHIIDDWDLDHPFERLLVETAVAPDTNEVKWINPKIKPVNGARSSPASRQDRHRLHARSQDRRVPLGAPTVYQNVVSTIDGATGKVTVNPERSGRRRMRQVDLPGQQRRQELAAGAYSPTTNAMYMPLQNMCMNAKVTVDTRDPSKVYGLEMPGVIAPMRKAWSAR
jgi:alcohol dehydrogenase (cytochrome c)